MKTLALLSLIAMVNLSACQMNDYTQKSLDALQQIKSDLYAIYDDLTAALPLFYPFNQKQFYVVPSPDQEHNAAQQQAYEALLANLQVHGAEVCVERSQCRFDAIELQAHVQQDQYHCLAQVKAKELTIGRLYGVSSLGTQATSPLSVMRTLPVSADDTTDLGTTEVAMTYYDNKKQIKHHYDYEIPKRSDKEAELHKKVKNSPMLLARV